MFKLKEITTHPVATIAASVLSTFIIAALFFKFAGPVPISVTQTSIEKQSSFDVTGTGTITAVPDTAVVDLGITVNRSTVASAQNEANQTINQINDSLIDLGISKENIKTSNYSVYPDYDHRSGNNRIRGYRINATLNVKIADFDKLNQAIDTTTSLGANQVGGITFTLSKDKQKEIESEARKEAIDQAKQKAKDLAKAAGIKLGKIINVQEDKQDPSPFPLRTLETTAIGTPDQEPTQIEPGSTEVKLSITLSYETL